MKKVLFVASVYGFLESFEINNMKLLQEEGYEVYCAANDYDKLRDIYFQTPKLDNIGVIKKKIDFARNPLSKENINAYKQLHQLLNEVDFDLIDCHTPMGGVIARLVARKQRKQGRLKVMYTAHGFHFYKGAPLKNWIFFYPIEKWLSKYTDVMITINKEDYECASKKFKMKQIEYVPGIGIDIEKFQRNDFDRHNYRKQFGLKDTDIALLSVGEVNVNKNHKIVVKALGELKNTHLHYVIAGQGDQKENLMHLARQLGVEKNLHLLGFRKDIVELYHCADIFIHPSLREGLPVALMEAMASGLPIIASDIRGNADLIDNYKGGRLLPLNEHETYTEAIQTYIENHELCQLYQEYNKLKLEKFSSKEINVHMASIYKNIKRSVYNRIDEGN